MDVKMSDYVHMGHPTEQLRNFDICNIGVYWGGIPFHFGPIESPEIIIRACIILIQQCIVYKCLHLEGDGKTKK